MSYRETEHLRVLIANERKDRLALVAPIVAALGHEVIAREIEVEDVGAVTARERPDVALVGLGESSEHALGLIEKIVRESACPVIALIHAPDPDFVREASKRGVFAYITDAEAKDWQSSIDIVLRRFAEYHDLEGAFGRRAITERAKGILMERHCHRRGHRLQHAARPLAPPTASSSTSRAPSSTATACYQSSRALRRAATDARRSGTRLQPARTASGGWGMQTAWARFPCEEKGKRGVGSASSSDSRPQESSPAIQGGAPPALEKLTPPWRQRIASGRSSTAPNTGLTAPSRRDDGRA